MKHYALVLVGLLILATGFAKAETALGDWGHFLSYYPRATFNNPEGKDFTITIHTLRYIRSAKHYQEVPIHLAAPDGRVLVNEKKTATDNKITLEIKDASPGVYRLALGWTKTWIESSLDQSVLYTGRPGFNLHSTAELNEDGMSVKKVHPKLAYYEGQGPAVFMPVVPRRWWFWVPEGTTEFTARALRDMSAMSQREDWGIFVISPRGQRVKALWGQPEQFFRASGKYGRYQKVKVEVEPGAAGRFWMLEIALGDSHHISDINVCLDGVPPYISRSPEEWFNPETGKAPTPIVYDTTPFMQAIGLDGKTSFSELHQKARRRGKPGEGSGDFRWTPELLAAEKSWPNLHHFAPCPSLGDPDGNEMLGDARLALRNPEGRKLRLYVGSYLLPEDRPTPDAHVKVIDATGKTAFDRKLPLKKILGPKDTGLGETIETGKGVAYVSITGTPRWMALTYPATPLVLIGQDKEGFSEFRFTACAAKNWYFFVPRGTERFSVRFTAPLPEDVLHMEVCSPDRTVHLFYGRKGEHTIEVPGGLDGKVWYVRPSVGSGSKIGNPQNASGYWDQDIQVVLGLKGVPGYIAPTREQWFRPEE